MDTKIINSKKSIGEFIKPLNQCGNNEVGTKAKNLKKITEETDYLIPKTLMLNTGMYKQLIKYNKIKNPLTFNWGDFSIPLDYKNQITEKIREFFNNKSLVIRSSATCEDSPILSFAGQYSTFLNIKGEKNILKAIKLCYLSLFGENAKIYARFNNVKLENEEMAIAIQEVIPVKNSGIIFTADPISRNDKKIIIEYTKGFGDEIVSGDKQPEYVEFFKKDKSIPIFLKPLVELAIKLEKIFKYPQNIEWGFDGKSFYIFQSRHITTLKNKLEEEKIDNKKLIFIMDGKVASMGQAKGRLKVIKQKRDYQKISEGDIIMNIGKSDMKIITKIPQIAGIITKGGVLSHFAVISREFNKPCILESSTLNLLQYNNKNIFLDAIQGKIFLIK